MPDRSSEASQQYTLTVDGFVVGGWSEVTVPDQDVVTGQYTPGGGRASVVTVGQVRQTGAYVLTKQYDHAAFSALEARVGREGTVTGAKVDTDGRIVNSYRPATGVLAGVSRGGMNSSSGEALLMMVRFQADG